nr:hypothetical protein [uncultured Oscillibacter sp.]
MARATQPVSVDGIEFDALMSSTEAFDATVPEYSVETGFAVSDTIILAPETLDMTLLVSNRPVTWAKRFGNAGDRVAQVVKRLKELYFKKKLITVTTSSDTYTDMAITSLSIPKTNAMMEAIEIPIKFKKVRVTATKTATIPDSYGKSGASAASAGTASTSKGSGWGGSAAGSGSSSGSSGGGSNGNGSQKSGSILYSAAAGMGLMK